MGERTTTVVVHPDASVLAAAVAARLVTALTDAQAAHGSASVVVTGGSTGNAVLAALGRSSAGASVNWSRVEVWWGDERFLPGGDGDRNHTQAADALAALALDPARVHLMPASDGPDGEDVEAAAERYAAELASVAARDGDPGPLPRLDVLMLGVGPDAHVASLFPEQPALHEQERTVVGVHGAPKPPPTRISLTLPTLCSADEVWLMTAGEDKAKAVALAHSGAGPLQAPAGAAQGRRATRWLLDRASASQLGSLTT